MVVVSGLIMQNITAGLWMISLAGAIRKDYKGV